MDNDSRQRAVVWPCKAWSNPQDSSSLLPGPYEIISACHSHTMYIWQACTGRWHLHTCVCTCTCNHHFPLQKSWPFGLAQIITTSFSCERKLLSQNSYYWVSYFVFTEGSALVSVYYMYRLSSFHPCHYPSTPPPSHPPYCYALPPLPPRCVLRWGYPPGGRYYPSHRDL